MITRIEDDRATVDINTFARNLRTRRSGETAAEYARAVHHETVEHQHKLAEKAMLILIGAFAALIVLIPAMR